MRAAAGPQEVDCAVTGPKVITINLGEGDDSATIACNGFVPPSDFGDAFISGGPGDDQLRGGPGFDAISGDDGNDTIDGCTGDDSLKGGAGDDTFSPSLQGSDDVSGGLGTDTVVLDARHAFSPHAEWQFDVSLDDVRNDSVVFGPSGAGLDNIHSDVENVDGSFLRDNITGSSAPNRLEGNGGNDVIKGGSPTGAAVFVNPIRSTIPIRFVISAHDDVILGGPGDDDLSGDGGNDLMDGGVGADKIRGGDAGDTILARDAIADPVLDCGAGTDDIDIDLRDAPVPPPNCENVDDGALREKANVVMPQRSVRLRQGRLDIAMRCLKRTDCPCRGRLTADARSHRLGAIRYRIGLGKRQIVHLAVRRVGSARSVRLTSVEKGRFGAKTTIRTVQVRRPHRAAR